MPTLLLYHYVTIGSLQYTTHTYEKIRCLMFFHNKTKSFNYNSLQTVWYIETNNYLCITIKNKQINQLKITTL